MSPIFKLKTWDRQLHENVDRWCKASLRYLSLSSKMNDDNINPIESTVGFGCGQMEKLWVLHTG